MFGVLKVILGGDGVAGRHGVPCKRRVFFRDMHGGAANLYVRTTRFVVPAHSVLWLAAPPPPRLRPLRLCCPCLMGPILIESQASKRRKRSDPHVCDVKTTRPARQSSNCDTLTSEADYTGPTFPKNRAANNAADANTASGRSVNFLVALCSMASSSFQPSAGAHDEVASLDDPIPKEPDFQSFFWVRPAARGLSQSCNGALNCVQIGQNFSPEASALRRRFHHHVMHGMRLVDAGFDNDISVRAKHLKSLSENSPVGIEVRRFRRPAPSADRGFSLRPQVLLSRKKRYRADCLRSCRKRRRRLHPPNLPHKKAARGSNPKAAQIFTWLPSASIAQIDSNASALRQLGKEGREKAAGARPEVQNAKRSIQKPSVPHMAEHGFDQKLGFGAAGRAYAAKGEGKTPEFAVTHNARDRLAREARPLAGQFRSSPGSAASRRRYRKIRPFRGIASLSAKTPQAVGRRRQAAASSARQFATNRRIPCQTRRLQARIEMASPISQLAAEASSAGSGMGVGIGREQARLMLGDQRVDDSIEPSPSMICGRL